MRALWLRVLGFVLRQIALSADSLMQSASRVSTHPRVRLDVGEIGGNESNAEDFVSRDEEEDFESNTLCQASYCIKKANVKCPNGAMLIQPRATPWEDRRKNISSPVRATEWVNLCPNRSLRDQMRRAICLGLTAADRLAVRGWARFFRPFRACAGEVRVNVGESPTCRIKLFTAENDGRVEDREVRT
jgi:hypothetical protein